uniref:Uncharacterized protein n=1 Tax=Arundo donax TaxID=35708 RepID=A0A0A8YEU3_ARUDO
MLEGKQLRRAGGGSVAGGVRR